MEKKIFCPGDVIKNLLKKFNYTQRDLAEKLEMDLKTVNEILNGKAPITIDTAINLEYIFDLDASYWNKLEFEYKLTLKMMEEQKIIENEYEIIRKIYKELSDRECVLKTSNKNDMVINYRKFMEIISLEQLKKSNYQLDRFEVNDEILYLKLLSWAQIGLKKSRNKVTVKYNKEKIIEDLSNIKKLSNLDYEQVENTLIKLCEENGIILDFEENLINIPICGYSKWLTPEKPFIQLAKFENVEKLLYNFLFELNHIINGKKKMIYYNSELLKLKSTEEKEDSNLIVKVENIKADKFANNYLKMLYID